jgi:hypothetical protein
VAIFVAVFVLDANFYSTLGPILVVITPTVAFSVRTIIVSMHLPIATHRTMVPIPIAIHSFPHLSHIALAHAPHIVAAALLCSPIATDPGVLSALPILVAGLFRLLGRALRLHRRRLRLIKSRRLFFVLGE